MTRIIIGWDVETHLIMPGSNTPKLVCLSASGGDDSLGAVQRWLAPSAAGQVLLTPDTTFCLPHVWGRNRNHEWEIVVPADQALDFLLAMVEVADVLVAANGRYDWAVMCNEHPELLPVVAHYLEEGKIACTQIREQLWSIATGNFKYDTRTKRKDPVFSLAYLVLRQQDAVGCMVFDDVVRTHGDVCEVRTGQRLSEVLEPPIEWDRALELLRIDRFRDGVEGIVGARVGPRVAAGQHRTAPEEHHGLMTLILDVDLECRHSSGGPVRLRPVLSECNHLGGGAQGVSDEHRGL